MMDRTEIMAYLREDMDRVNDLILRSLDSDIDLLNHTNRALLSRRGKQLRPMLALLAARACSGGIVTEDTIRFAAASELLHNATLLHDDVADGSTQRRGAPTVMSLLGSRASVLLGDFWLVRAVGRILDATRETDRVIRIFSKTLSDLAEGEMLQLQKASAGDTTQEDYLRIIYNKTASLFVATAQSAAVSVQATPEQEEAVHAYAEALGIAFQIKDDIFDYEEDARIGKPVGQDLHEQKITQPLLCALEAAPDRDEEIRSMVVSITDVPSVQADIVRFVKENGGLESARRHLDKYVDQAVAALQALPSGRDRDALADLAHFVADRKS